MRSKRQRFNLLVCLLLMFSYFSPSLLVENTVHAESSEQTSVENLNEIIELLSDEDNWKKSKSNGKSKLGKENDVSPQETANTLKTYIENNDEIYLNRISNKELIQTFEEILPRLKEPLQQRIASYLLHINKELLSDLSLLTSFMNKQQVNIIIKPSTNKYENAQHHFSKGQYNQSLKKVDDSVDFILSSFEDLGLQYNLQADDDKDMLKNFEEFHYKTNPLKKDTDGDSLTDYNELFSGVVEPLKKDTDGDGIPDGNEDTDNDGLTNIEEQDLGTDFTNKDSDQDGINDKQEQEYGTDPLSVDSDNDKLHDGDELKVNTDPLNPDTNSNGILDGEENYTYNVTPKSSERDEEVSPSVEITGKGSEIFTTSIKNVEDKTSLLSKGIPGYIGAPFDFETDVDFSEANISFEYSPELENQESFHPAIFYYNEGTGLLEKVESQEVNVDTNKVTATVSHFSTYILLNEKEWDDVWDKEFSRGSRSTNEDGEVEYIDLVFSIDSSGSMSWNDPEDLRKEAVKNFVDKLLEQDKSAVVDFDSNAEILVNLTTDKEEVKLAVDTIDSNGGTDIYDAVNTSVNELLNRGTNSQKYIILLTDGVGSYNNTVTQRAKDNGITIFTIGLGDEVDESLLKQIAEDTGGKYYFASNPEELTDRYGDVADDTTSAFKDSDNDGLTDYEEENGIRLANGEVVTTDMNDPDTDGDGILDGQEAGELVNVSGYGNMYKFLSHPKKTDTDGDGMTDDIEIYPVLKYDYNNEKFVTNEYYQGEWYDSDAVDYTIPLLFVHGRGASEGTFTKFMQYADTYDSDSNIRHYVSESIHVSESGNLSYKFPIATNNIVTHTSRLTGRNVEIGHGVPMIAVQFDDNLASFESQGNWMKKIMDSVKSKFGNKEINVVAHSMGGIATSYYLLDNPNEGFVNTFVTLGTPFKGSGWADIAFGNEADRDLEPDSDAIKRLRNPLPSDINMMTIAGYGDVEPPAPIPKSKAYYQSSGDGIVSVKSALGANKPGKEEVLVDGYHTYIAWAPVLGRLPYGITEERDNANIVLKYLYYKQVPSKNKYGLSATKHIPIE